MPSKINTPAPPPLGTFIDNDGLELVEVLGVGGYGVVYRAVETRSCQPKSYAVKCLIQSQPHQRSRQRQLHIREITLHQLASAHPGVATLHRVIEEYSHTYIIMEYASDGDLFGQILNSCRYLGNDALIKHVFLQLLDAVEYCHSLGIYHRDLKPENVLCFDAGLRIAITDFGLATTERFSEEFRTGSVYHMSPECQGGSFAPTGTYSPLFNDIWSLAIILLNLATGRNPWKSASASDPTFQAYLQDPFNFLPTVLPISAEANAVLTQMLEVDWRHRMTLTEVRKAIEGIDSFYSDGVVFEGSMARCPWEVGVDIESESESSETKGEPEELPEQQESRSDLQSYWSTDSDSEMKFASPSVVNAQSSWMNYSTRGASWGFENSERSCSPSPPPAGTFAMYDAPRTPPSTYSPLSSRSSLPATPEGLDIPMEYKTDGCSKPLRVDTKCIGHRFFEGHFSANESGMQTAVESEIYDPFAASSFFLASPPPASAISMAMPSTVDLGSPSTLAAKGVGSMSSWDYSADDDDESRSSRPSMSTSRADSILDIDEEFDVEDMVISPDMQHWPVSTPPASTPHPRHVIPAFSLFLGSSSSTTASSSSSSSSKKSSDDKSKGVSLFSSIKFAFPRSPRTSIISVDSSQSRDSSVSDSFVPMQTVRHTPSPPPHSASWHFRSSPKHTSPYTIPDSNCRQEARLRSGRRWFSPGKLFTSAGAS